MPYLQDQQLSLLEVGCYTKPAIRKTEVHWTTFTNFVFCLMSQCFDSHFRLGWVMKSKRLETVVAATDSNMTSCK